MLNVNSPVGVWDAGRRGGVVGEWGKGEMKRVCWAAVGGMEGGRPHGELELCPYPASSTTLDPSTPPCLVDASLAAAPLLQPLLVMLWEHPTQPHRPPSIVRSYLVNASSAAATAAATGDALGTPHPALLFLSCAYLVTPFQQMKSGEWGTCVRLISPANEVGGVGHMCPSDLSCEFPTEGMFWDHPIQLLPDF
ncbi:unnamed protein product [Closterium sp. Naga37s-1]|nr:unnamed protein product [Closterium sp. Naga37s-1]